MDKELIEKYGCNRCKISFYTEEQIEKSEKATDIFGKLLCAKYCDECLMIVRKEKADAENKQLRLESIHDNLRYFKVPKFIKLSENDLNPKEKPVGDVMRFLLNDSWCFYLFGDYGSGKTHMVYWILKRAITKGVFFDKSFNHTQRDALHFSAVEAVEAGEIISLYQAEYKKREGDSEKAIQKYKDVGLLFIDDLGAERDSDDSRRILEDLLCYRYNHALKTIITANVPASDMSARYSGRLASRLTAGENCALIHADRRAL